MKEWNQAGAGGAMDQTAVDAETFARVWRRVMPDQALSPIAVGRVAQSGMEPDAAQPQMQPGPAQTQALSLQVQPGPPQVQTPGARTQESQAEAPYLGEASSGYARQLREMMDGAQMGWRSYRGLARRTVGGASRILNALAAEQRRGLQRLAASYFLITGEHYRPIDAEPARISPLAMALREEFLQEQKWQRTYQWAAAQCGDPCLAGQYRELEEQARDHAAAIRQLLEQMQPLPGTT